MPDKKIKVSEMKDEIGSARKVRPYHKPQKNPVKTCSINPFQYTP